MRHYEDLKGGTGQRMFYRAERFEARGLFKGPMPLVELDGALVSLQNLSMSGLALFAPHGADQPQTTGAEVAVRLLFENTELHHGRARIVRIERTPLGTRLAVNLIHTHLDVRQLVERHEEVLLRCEVEHGLGEGNARLVAPEYRLLCADMRHLLHHYKSVLDRAHAHDDERSRTEILTLCQERIMPQWQALWFQANALVKPLMDQPEALRATKRYTEMMLTPEFIAGPIWQRAYGKPLGYPGDYQVMNYVYTWFKHGNTSYARLLHRLGLDGLECVATRMSMVQQVIAEIVAAGPAHRPARIANLACGTAQEIVNYLQAPKLPRAVHFTLIDQDQDALGFAYQNTYPRVVALQGTALVSCLHADFPQLLKAGPLFQKLLPQDLIYTVGLIDYLSQRRAKILIAALYAQLAPGGELLIANLSDAPNNGLWLAEFICNWTMVYRTEAEMHDLIGEINPGPVSLELDRTGRIYVMRVKKAL